LSLVILFLFLLMPEKIKPGRKFLHPRNLLVVILTQKLSPHSFTATVKTSRSSLQRFRDSIARKMSKRLLGLVLNSKIRGLCFTRLTKER